MKKWNLTSPYNWPQKNSRTEYSILRLIYWKNNKYNWKWEIFKEKSLEYISIFNCKGSSFLKLLTCHHIYDFGNKKVGSARNYFWSVLIINAIRQSFIKFHKILRKLRKRQEKSDEEREPKAMIRSNFIKTESSYYILL